MNDENIHLHSAFNETEVLIVERLICTLRTGMRIWCYFTANKIMRYIDMLPDLVYAYNHTVHCGIKMKHALVNHDNEESMICGLLNTR